MGTRSPEWAKVAILPAFQDGRLETMALLVYQVEMWDDPRLVWKPEDFGNMSKIYVKPEVIWTPRSYLPNM